MTIIQAIILALIQGIAEFLPISSSGHLMLAQRIMGLEDVPILFDIILHCATLIAVVIYFHKKIWLLLCSLGRLIIRRPRVETDDEDDVLCGSDERSHRTLLAIFLSTIVTGALGFTVQKYLLIDGIKWFYKLLIIAGGFVLTALLLVGSSLFEKKVSGLSSLHQNGAKQGFFSTLMPFGTEGIVWYKALLIGLFQGVGTLPGVSRSGATIAASLFCGVEREIAGVYSFLVSIPAILGALVLDFKDLGTVMDSVSIPCMIIGVAVAFAAGLLSLSILMKVIKKGKLIVFSPYLGVVAIASLIFLR